jgi:hypothetical protein
MIQNLTDLFGRAERSVTHLECRDTYGLTVGFRAWQEGAPAEEIMRFEPFQTWAERVRRMTHLGVSFRRARIISEPVSEFIRYEHIVTANNIAAGEQVRWLPRPQAAELALPGADFWQIDDDGPVCFVFQTGDGDPAGHRICEDDPGVMRLCSTAFDAVWERAIDHSEYRPA